MYESLDACVVNRSVSYGVVQPGTAQSEGVPIVRVNNFRDGRIDLTDLMKISPAIEAKYARTRLKGGEVLVTLVGSVGQVAIASRELSGFNVARAVSVVQPISEIGPEWISLCLRSPLSQHLLNSRANTTVQTTINLKDLKALPIPIPPENERAQIAEMVFALDDRIALLRETNATLEAIAQALFKSWFIDFDPVRAKAEGREPEGLDADSAALFPDGFDESELGLVPREWTVSTLFEHIRAERGLSYKGAGLCSPDEGRPMHNLNSVYEGGGYKYPGIKFYRGDFKERHVAHAGDIIVTNTEQGHQHRLIGFPAIVPERYDTGIFSHHLYRLTIRPESPLTPHVLYYLLMSPAVREQVIGCANGSTVNMLKIEGMEIPRFVCAPAPVARAFEDMTVSMRKQAELNVTRAESLAEVRETLLPRLISGQLRIPEVEALLEDAA